MIFDTHAHYTDARFDEDREELLAGMKARGVGEIVEVGAPVQDLRGFHPDQDPLRPAPVRAVRVRHR